MSRKGRLHSSALCILNSLRRKQQYLEFRHAIMENIGFAYSIEGDHRRSASAYRSLATQDSTRVSAACSWLLNALQCGDQRSALDAAAVLDETPTNAGGIVVEVTRTLIATRESGTWSALPVAFNTLRTIEQDLGPLSGQVANALH